jgi:hypothetical protein
MVSEVVQPFWAALQRGEFISPPPAASADPRNAEATRSVGQHRDRPLTGTNQPAKEMQAKVRIAVRIAVARYPFQAASRVWLACRISPVAMTRFAPHVTRRRSRSSSCSSSRSRRIPGILDASSVINVSSAHAKKHAAPSDVFQLHAAWESIVPVDGTT